MAEVAREQREVCDRFSVAPVPAPEDLKVGLARNVGTGVWPLNGLRHPPGRDTTGWYIWAGEELSQAGDFFQPVHVAHLATLCPEVLRFLQLPPGWRFLCAPGHLDIWYDPSLLNVSDTGPAASPDGKDHP